MDLRRPRLRTQLAGALALALLLSVAPLAVAAPGDLDPSFDGDGKVDTVFGSGWAQKMALDSAGRIILAGGAATDSGTMLAMARLDDDGSLDTSFDGDGRLVTDRWASLPIAGVAVDGLDRIVLGGHRFTHLARYLSDGSLDVAFEEPTTLPGDFREPHALAVDDTGNVVMAGTVYTDTIGDFAVVRWLANGSLDTGFGGDGVVITDLYPTRHDDESAHGVVMDNTGRIVVAGSLEWGFMVVMRHNLDGSLDSTFGSNGKRVFDFPGGTNAYAMAVTIDDAGRIILAGHSGIYGAHDFAVARLNPDGSLDTTFGGGDGMESTDFGGSNDAGDAVAVDSLGRIVVAGNTGDYPHLDFALARYNPNGTLDSTFGGGDGKVITNFAGERDQAWATAVDPFDRILVAGTACSASACDFAVARYLGGPTFKTYLPLVLR